MCSQEVKKVEYNKDWEYDSFRTVVSKIHKKTLYTPACVEIFVMLILMHFNVKLLLHNKGITDVGVAGENIWP